MMTGTVDEIMQFVTEKSDYVSLRQLYDCHKKPLEGYKEMWSVRRQSTVSIVSDDYAPVQNIEAIGPFMLALNSLPNGEDIRYRYNMIEEVGRFRLEILNPQASIIPMDGKAITLGWALGNSFDTTRSVFLESFMHRLICSNGMSVRRLMGGVRIKHIGEKTDVIGALRQYINEMGSKSHEALNAIDWSYRTPIVKGSPRKILFELGFTQKAAREILRQEASFRSMWDFYNATTAYASHEQVGFTAVQTAERAEEMLIEARTIQKRVENVEVPKEWGE